MERIGQCRQASSRDVDVILYVIQKIEALVRQSVAQSVAQSVGQRPVFLVNSSSAVRIGRSGRRGVGCRRNFV